MSTNTTAGELTRSEKLGRLRTAITFASNTAPYALTYAEADDLLDFIDGLENESSVASEEPDADDLRRSNVTPAQYAQAEAEVAHSLAWNKLKALVGDGVGRYYFPRSVDETPEVTEAYRAYDEAVDTLGERVREVLVEHVTNAVIAQDKDAVARYADELTNLIDENLAIAEVRASRDAARNP